MGDIKECECYYQTIRLYALDKLSEIIIFGAIISKIGTHFPLSFHKHLM